AGTGRFRDRGARFRSAPAEAAAHHPAQWPAAAPHDQAATARSGCHAAAAAGLRQGHDVSAASGFLTRVSHAVMLSWGWRRAALALAAGAGSALALAPFNAWPVLFLTFPVAVWLIEGASAGRLGGIVGAAVVGWLFGLGYFVAGLYWIGIAFLVDAKTFAWLIPFAVLGLPAYLALFTAAAFAAARLFWMPGHSRLLALAVCLSIVECQGV